MPSKTTITPRELSEVLDNLATRIKGLEQRITNPRVVGQYPSSGMVVNDIKINNVHFGTQDQLDPVSNVAVTSTGLYSDVWADVTWTPPVNGSVDHYVLWLATFDGVLYSNPVAHTIPYTTPSITIADDTEAEVISQTTVRLRNLTNGQFYGLRIVAVAPDGSVGHAYPDESTWYSFQAGTDVSIPSTPTGYRLVSSVSSVLAQWNDNPEPDVALNKGSYDVQFDTAPTFNSIALQTFRVSGTTATIVGLPSVQYYSRIRAIDTTGNASPWSAAITVTPQAPYSSGDGSVPSVAGAPQVYGLVGSLFAKWAAVANSSIVTYDVYVGTSSSFIPSTATFSTSTTATTAVLKDVNGAPLLPTTVYYVRVVARDADGSAAASGPSAGATFAQATTADIAVGAITATSGIIGSLDAGTITVGTMDGSHITAGTLNADRIAAGTITSDRISAVGLDAATIKFGTMSGDRITAGSMSAGAIKASTITSDLTIASRLKTADTGARVELNSLGVYAYNNQGVQTFRAGSDGSVLVSGNISGGSLQMPESAAVSPGFTYVDSGGMRSIPIATTNTVPNPNFQTGLAGVAAGSGTTVVTAGAPRLDSSLNVDLVPKYGKQALKAHSAPVGSTFTINLGNLTAGQIYTVSWHTAAGRVDDGNPGFNNTYGDYSKVKVLDSTGATVDTGVDGQHILPGAAQLAGYYGGSWTSGIRVTAYAGWKVRWVTTFTATTTGAHKLQLPYPVTSGGAVDTTMALHVGGVQCEANPVMTRYCDGDQVGCSWTGATGNSTSTRPTYGYNFYFPNNNDPYISGSLTLDRLEVDTIKIGTAAPHGSNYFYAERGVFEAVTDGVWRALAWDATTLDARSANDDGVLRPNQTDIVAPVSGIYAFMVTVTWPSGSWTGRRYLRAVTRGAGDSGATEIARETTNAANFNNNIIQTVSGIYYRRPGEILHFEVFSSGDGNQNVMAHSTGTPNLIAFSLLAGT